MKNKEELLLLGIMVIITVGVNYVISLCNFQLWVGLILYTLSFIVVVFIVLFVAELIDKRQTRQRKIRILLYEEKVKKDKRDRLRKEQGEIIDWNLAKRKIDWNLVQEEIDLIKQNINSSIEQEQISIGTKQATIEGYKQLLAELEGVNNNNEKTN